MPQFHRSTCRVCGKPASPEEPISGKGFCLEHGMERMYENNRQISECRGPYFQRWRERIAASVGAKLDDPQPQE